MGNSYSVAREEREEEEFLSLVEAVEIAQQRSVQQNDVEMGLGHSFHTAHRRGHGLAPDRPEQDKVSRGERYQQALERPEWNIASQPEATVIPTAAVVMDTRGQSRSPASRHEPIGFSADCASSLNESLIPPPPVIMATPAACQLPILIQPAPLAPAPPTQWPGAVTASCLPTIPAVVRVQTIESPTLGSPEEEVPTLAMPEVSSSPLSPATVMGESIPEQPALSSFHQVIRPITLSESSSSPHSPSSTPSSLPHSVQSSRSRSRSRSPRRSQTSPTPIIITNASIHSRYSSTRYRPISQPATATPVPIPQEAGPATPRHYPAHSQSPSFGAARYRRSPERPLERSRYHSPRRSHAFGWGSHCPSPERYRTRPSSRVARHSYYAAPRRQRSRESAQSKPRSPSQVDEARGRDTAPSPLRSSRDGDRPLRTSVAGLSYGRDPMNNISAVNIEGVVSVHPS
ncbi:hypothetical protein C8Q79DRAFT_461252 [Trametes meyenii]|nr:hypothetical protein C8Q79DRAFT_461252 [Trametes meyenii]